MGRDWTNRKHAVEEGVDGVEQAPEDVGDGAGAHHGAPLHHAAVLYERHLSHLLPLLPPPPRSLAQGRRKVTISVQVRAGHGVRGSPSTFAAQC